MLLQREREHMVVLCRQRSCSSGALGFFDNTGANIRTGLQDDNFDEEQAVVKFWAANDAWEFVYRHGTRKVTPE